MEGIVDNQTKVWICNRCKSVFGKRWLLSRHLKQVHHLPSKDVSSEAITSEWWRVYNPKLKELNRRSLR
jgi:hypothetical protein